MNDDLWGPRMDEWVSFGTCPDRCGHLSSLHWFGHSKLLFIFLFIRTTRIHGIWMARNWHRIRTTLLWVDFFFVFFLSLLLLCARNLPYKCDTPDSTSSICAPFYEFGKQPLQHGHGPNTVCVARVFNSFWNSHRWCVNRERGKHWKLIYQKYIIHSDPRLSHPVCASKIGKMDTK